MLLFLLAGLVAVLVHTRHEGAASDARKYVRVKRNNTATQETDSNGDKRKRDNEESINTEDGPPDTKRQKIDDGIDSKSSWWEKAGAIAGGASLLTLPLMFIPMGGGGGGDDLQSQLQNTDPMPVISSSSSSSASVSVVVLALLLLLMST